MSTLFYFCDCDDDEVTMTRAFSPTTLLSFQERLDSDEFYTLPMWF